MNSTTTMPTQTRRRKPGKGFGPLHEPAAFVDGPNQYQYVGGDPLGAVDPMGLTWTVARAGQNRAVAKGECGDTIEDLARLTNMDPVRYGVWARPLDNQLAEVSAQTKLTYARTFSIPNKVFIAVGDMSFTANVLTGDTPQKIKDILLAKGFSVEYRDWRWDRKWGAMTIVNQIEDLYGFVYFGHGGYSTKFGKLLGTSNGIMIVDPWGSNNAETVRADTFTDGRLGLLLMKSCGAKQGGWGNAASSNAKQNGAVWLGDGLEAAGFVRGMTEAAEKAQ